MTQIDESEFQARADATLETLFDALEDAIGDEADIDLREGVLSIVLPTGGQYVINKHAPNRQIWLSSPKSGAAHFDLDPARGWVSTRGDVLFADLLKAELGLDLPAD